MKYYLHRNLDWYHNYFNYVGPPYKVSKYKYLVAKYLGYRATAVEDNMTITDVYVQSAIQHGAHPTSYAVEQIREGSYPGMNCNLT